MAKNAFPTAQALLFPIKKARKGNRNNVLIENFNLATRRVVVRLHLQFPLCSVLVLPVIAPGNVHLSASLATTSREGGAEQELLPRPEAGKGFAGICEIKQEIRQYKHVCTSPCVCASVCVYIYICLWPDSITPSSSVLRTLSPLCGAASLLRHSQAFLALNILFLFLLFAHFVVETCTCPLSSQTARQPFGLPRPLHLYQLLSFIYKGIAPGSRSHSLNTSRRAAMLLPCWIHSIVLSPRSFLLHSTFGSFSASSL